MSNQDIDPNNLNKQNISLSPYLGLDGLFLGTYSHSLDTKGRIIIPNSFRANLGEKFVIGVTRDFLNIAIYKNEAYLKIINEIAEQAGSEPAVQKYSAMFTRNSFQNQECDGQGRILIPQKLRNYFLKDEKEIESVGEIECIRIHTLKDSENFVDEFMKCREQNIEEYNRIKKEKDLYRSK